MLFRDTTITASTKRKELIIFCICLLAACLLNVIGIVKHHSPARELITQLPTVLLVTLVFYGTIVILRLLYHLISRIWIR